MEKMKNIEETYRQRLGLLITQFGSQAALARQIDRTPSQLNQWVVGAPNSATGKPRSMSSRTARHIEKATGKPEGWMDQPLSKSSQTKPEEDYITFDLLNIQAAAGTGLATPDQIEVLEEINVLKSWAQQVIGGDLSRIKLISARGDSMKPTFDNQDILFVDHRIKQYVGEGIYIISAPDLRAKRLQQLLDGSIRVISDNSGSYQQETVSGQALDNLVICGKVVAVWSFNPLK